MGWGGVVLPGQGIPGTNGNPGTVQDITGFLSQIAPSLLSGAATAIQQQQMDAAKNYILGVGNIGHGLLNQGVGSGSDIYGQQTQGLQGLLSGSNPWMQQLSQGLLPNIATLNNLLPSLVQGGNANLSDYAGLPANQIYQDPNAANALKGISDLSGTNSGLLNWASNMINNGGITNTQVPLGSYASSLMSGTNPFQQALGGAGGAAMANGGMTPQLQQALQQAMGVVSGGGATPLTDQLAQRGLDLSGANGGNPLLSMNQLASFVQDQSGRNFANAAQTARTQAEERGQGPGSVVAGGNANQALADFSNQALQGTSQALQGALSGQQGLNLQQLAQGLNTGLSAADIQRSLELGGLGSVANLTNSGTSLLGTGGGLTGQAAGLGNTGAGLYNQLLGLQQSNLQQGLNTGFQGIGTQQGLMQTTLQDLLQGQTGQANLGNMLANLYLGNQGQYAGAIGQGLGANQNALQQLGAQGSNWLGLAGTGMGGINSTVSSIADLFRAPNAISTYLNSQGQPTNPLGQATSNILRPPTIQLPPINTQPSDPSLFGGGGGLGGGIGGGLANPLGGPAGPGIQAPGAPNTPANPSSTPARSRLSGMNGANS